MPPTITALIPCYNGAPFLAEAIASVRAQTRPVDEVIVVDDCSTDGSAELAERLGARVLRTPRNMGSAAARNLGLREAGGDLVALLDADDYWLPGHVETIAGLLERHPEAVLAFGLVRCFGDATDDWPALLAAGEPVQATWDCLRRCVLPQNAVVLRRAMVLDAGGYDERYRLAQDFDLWLRLSARHPFVCTHEVTACWRRHGLQNSRDMKRYWTGEYQSRQRFYEWCLTERPEIASRVAQVMREVWERHLGNAWHSRRAEHMAFHLGMAPLVTGAAARRNHWRVRRLLIPVARAWDASPTGLKALIRARRREVSVEGTA